MKTAGVLVLGAALGLGACQAEVVQPEMPEQAETDVLQELEDSRTEILAYLERHDGNWVSRGGALVCEGYMTRVADEEYCASDVPEDWQPLEFDGQTFYVQPLSQE